MRKSGENARKQGQQAYHKLVKATRQTIEQAQQVLPELQAMTSQEAKKLSEVLENFSHSPAAYCPNWISTQAITAVASPSTFPQLRKSKDS